MRKGTKEALLRVTEIVFHAESDCCQEVHGHDKEYEIFQFGALPSAALDAELLGPHRDALGAPADPRGTSEPAARLPDATGSTAGLPDTNTASGYGYPTRSRPQVLPVSR